MPPEFVHLHVHSEFSMLDSTVRIKRLLEETERLEMPAVALTDNANMYGAVQFYQAAAKRGIKPILGAEVNLVAGDRSDPKQRRVHHLVLLAASQEGYRNVVRLVSRGWVDGLVGGVPRVDFALLEEHREDVIALSGCMGGYLPQTILMDGPEAGLAALARLRDTFEPGRFFVELQDHGFPESRPLNAVMVDLATELDVPLVASNDCHYIDREEAQAHLALQSIGLGRGLREMEATHHGSSEMYLKGPAQMAKLFENHPEAIANTVRIAELCAGVANPLADPKLPRFSVPEQETEADFLRRISQEGLEERYAEFDDLRIEHDREVYQARLQVELDVIVSMGFPGYFLIVQDFIKWAKNNDVPVGPGRGSGAGSLVAYALRITDLDPIPYDLLFERFLNPERVSMPDFDIDFCMDKRDKVIAYVRDKYGASSVGQISTFHQLKSKSCVRDVGRVMGMAPADAGRIAGMIPEIGPGKSAPIVDAIRDTPRLKEVYESDALAKDVLDTAKRIENLTRHAGMHAAGVVISEGPLWDHVPVFCPDIGNYVTQYDKDDVEAAGLVKFDFLGLKTLTVIDVAVSLIDKRPDRGGEPFRLDKIPLTDPATFALLRSGETTNVFQLESSGMQSLFKSLKPDAFEDIVAAVALYRPGPMSAGMDKDFVERKHGRQRVTYPDPSLEHILKTTRGVIVYQEQVMQIARDMAGYSLGGADLLRRAMGKKKADVMAKQKETFVTGAQERGHHPDKAGEVFDLMAGFAQYGFNKSHSAAYALITYQTAYLKAHFPVEFVAGTLTADKEKSDKVVRTVNEARNMGITVLPPDVNESDLDFTVIYAAEKNAKIQHAEGKPRSRSGALHDPWEPKIIFGMGAIKGVGSSALESVLGERDGEGTKQPYTDLYDFCARVDLRRVNKSVAEALVQCGAFDAVHGKTSVHRAQAHSAVEAAFNRGKKLAAERDSGQTNLFGLLDASEQKAIEATTRGIFPDQPPWDSRELLSREKRTLGFYVSGHPLDRYAGELRRLCSTDSEGVAKLDDRTAVTIGGTVEGYRERRTKAGHDMGFFHLEDPQGRIEVIIRPRNLSVEGVRELLKSGEPIMMNGKVKHEVERGQEHNPEAPVETKLLLETVSMLSDALAKKTRRVAIQVGVDELDRSKLETLRKTLEAHPGPCPVSLELVLEQQWRVNLADTGLAVEANESLKASLERLLGNTACQFR